MHYGASVSEVADSTAARSQSLNPPYLLSTATQTWSTGSRPQRGSEGRRGGSHLKRRVRKAANCHFVAEEI